MYKNFISSSIVYVFINEKRCSSAVYQIGRFFGKDISFKEICENILPKDALELLKLSKAFSFFNKDQKLQLIATASQNEESINNLIENFSYLPKYALPVIILTALKNHESNITKIIQNEKIINIMTNKYIDTNFPEEYKERLKSYVVMGKLI